ncbi:efflux RND transporter periplasmic adaptor subunit [Corallococcus interemptor]|uniref:efflux RND transporter periplasmic adaptor subunit n=1 Tax=Corallococcus interemptor TaxID=2316720 RepID=UPI0035D4F543
MPRRSKQHRILVAGALVALLVGGGLVRHVLGTGVAVATVESRPLVQLVVMSGRVRSPGTATLAALVPGTVVQLPVEEGEAVEPGQLLVALEDAELRAEALRARGVLAEAQARLAQLRTVGARVAGAAQVQARAELERTRLQYERFQQLSAGGAASQAQLDDARSALEQARARSESADLQALSASPGGTERALAQATVMQAEAALLAAQTRLDHARIRAPAAGTVLRRLVEPGDSVQPGTALVLLARDLRKELEAAPDERSLAQLKPGQPARVSTDAFPGEVFDATLRYLAPQVDAERGTVTVRFDVPAPPPSLRPDMTVSISVETGRRDPALVLPTGAVRDAQGAAPWVLAVRDGRATRVPVVLGLRGEGAVEVARGLERGEQVILPSEQAVREGARVRPHP